MFRSLQCHWPQHHVQTSCGREILLWFRGAAVGDLVRGLASFPRTFLGWKHRPFRSTARFPCRWLYPTALRIPWRRHVFRRMSRFPLAAATSMQRTHIEKWAWLLADLVRSPNPSQEYVQPIARQQTHRPHPMPGLEWGTNSQRPPFK